MRIVHVDEMFMPTVGFQPNFLAKYAVRHGHDVTIVAGSSISYWTDSGFFPKEVVDNLEGLDREFEKKHGAAIIRVKSLGRILHRQVLTPGVFRIVRDLKPDVVLVHYCDTLTGVRFARKAPRLSYPMLSDCHMVEAGAEQSAGARRLFHRFYRRFVTPIFRRNAIPVIAVEADVKAYCMRNYGMTADMLPVMPFAADTMLFHPDEDARARFRREHGIGPDDFVCVYTGKIQPAKKVHLLAGAFRQRLEGHGRAVLILVGSGTGEYADQVRTLLDGSVNTVLAFPTQDVESLAQFYQAADLAVWPGACSLSFFDAQACGLPVVAERIPANEDRIRPEYDNGGLYEPNDEAGLRGRIEKLYAMDRNALRSMGENGRKIVLERYDYDKVATDVENLMASTRAKWLDRHK